MRMLILALVMIASTALAGVPVAATTGPSTSIDAPNKVERGDRVRIGVLVGYDGSRAPRGRVTVTLLRQMGEFKWTDSAKYRGEKVSFRTPRLHKRGGYLIKARFDAKPGTEFKDSDNRAEFRVTRRS